jgi:hypothetical protein
MEEWLKRALVDLAGVSAIAGILGFLIRQWITKAVEYRYQTLLEREKAQIEIQKKSAQDMLDKENALYPEIVELTYRIRNSLRDTIDGIRNGGRFNIEQLGELTFNFSEKLYSYRIYIDEETFKLLHGIKRSAQDAYLLLNQFSRSEGIRTFGPFGADPDDPELIRRKIAVLPRLDECYLNIDKYHNEAVPKIRSHIEGILRR